MTGPRPSRSCRLFVEVENLGTFDTGADPDSFAQPDSATWALVFGGEVGVITGEFKDLSEKKIRSFPAAEVADHVLDLYTDVAEGYPLTFPPVTFGPLAPLADELGHLGDGRAEHYKRLDSLFEHEQSQLVEGRHGRYIPRGLVPPAEQRRVAFTQAYRFYDRFRNGQSVREPWGDIDPAKVPPGPKRPDYDFHGYVAALGDYPLLLRPLGLAIDLVMKRDPQIPDEGRVRVRVDAPGDLAWTTDEVARPWTNYELRDRRFIPRPREREGELVDGTLRLESTRHFRVHQIDVDGSALKTVDFLGNVKRVKDHLQSVPRSMTPDESSLPALRGVGFTISRNDRAEQMVNRLDNAVLHDKDVTNKDPADLFAEDVTRGYRVDVEPNGKPFLSLCLRTGTYVVRTAGRRSTDPPAPRRGVPQGLVHDVGARRRRGAVPARSRRLVGRMEPRREATRPPRHARRVARRRVATRCSGRGRAARHRVPRDARDASAPALRLGVPDAGPRRRPGGQQRGRGGPRSPARQRSRDLLPVGAGAVTRGDPAAAVHRG